MSAHTVSQQVRRFWLFWQFAVWLVTQDLHKSHNGMSFSNMARLLLDFSPVFQNVSPCEIMWKIKQSLFIYLSGYGSCYVHQAWCHARRRCKRTCVTFKIGYSLLVQTLQNKLLWQVTLPTRSKIFVHGKIILIIESHKIKWASEWEWASEGTVLYYFVCPIFTLLSDISQILSHFLLVLS